MRAIKNFFKRYYPLLIAIIVILLYFGFLIYASMDRYKIKQNVDYEIENNDTLFIIKTRVEYGYSIVKDWTDETKNINEVKIIAEKRKIEADAAIEYDKTIKDMESDLQSKLNKKICK